MSQKIISSQPSISLAHQRYTVCVGINTYQAKPALSPLRYAENDARTLHELLLQRDFAPENSCLLLGSEATVYNIEKALKTFLVSRPQKDDLVVFYFAGHGLCIRGPEQDGQASTEVFLAGYDIDRTALQRDKAEWEDYPLRMGELRRRFFEKLTSKKVLFLLDSCHSGDFYGADYRDEPPSAEQYIGRAFAADSQGRVVISSCLPEQRAREQAELQHGMFTYYLLEALEGHTPNAVERDGWITVGSLLHYLTNQLGPDQCPVRSGVEQGTFRLLYYPEYAQSAIESATSQPSSSERLQRQQLLQAFVADQSDFIKGRLQNFVGRQTELQDLQTDIAELFPSGGYLTITGRAGQGKSSVIASLVQRYLAQHSDERVFTHFIPLKPGPGHQFDLLRNLMAQLLLAYDLPEFYLASDAYPALRSAFPKVLDTLVTQGKRALICIDGLDQLQEDSKGERDLSFLPTQSLPGIVFVLSTRPDTTLTTLMLQLGTNKTAQRLHKQYQLPNLIEQDFASMLLQRSVAVEQRLRTQLYQTLQGNALFLDLAATELESHEAVTPRRSSDDWQTIQKVSSRSLSDV